MKLRLRHLHRDERGMTFAFVAVGLMAFLAASTLAVDVGMFMTARSQAQTSADAGALARAVGLAVDAPCPASPNGVSTRVPVDVYRTTERNTSIGTLIGPLFGVPTVDIVATATAEAVPANAVSCVKPFTIPDRWTEKSVPPNGT